MPGSTKSTFSLDADSIVRLKRLALRWQVSKTEAVRRALSQAEAANQPTAEEKIAALHELQASLKRRNVDFDEWQRVMRDGRR